jgi:hypothetical protein
MQQTKVIIKTKHSNGFFLKQGERIRAFNPISSLNDFIFYIENKGENFFLVKQFPRVEGGGEVGRMEIDKESMIATILHNSEIVEWVELKELAC